MAIQHRARKRFGQNFLIDKAIIHSIITQLKPCHGDHLVEIGPGLGALTGMILQHTNQLTAIEIDTDLVAHLQASHLPQAGLTLLSGDALTFDYASLAHAQKLRLVGNLPYNIATPLLLNLLSCYHNHIVDMHFMLQLEVAERLIATPGNKTYGRLSLIVQYFCEASILFTVPPTAFRPQPQVESAVVLLKPYTTYPHACTDVTTLQQVTQHAFSTRRKTVKNTLKALITPSELQTLDIDSTQRPEQLTLADYIKISQFLTQ